MLKTLRITSLIALVLAVCGVLLIVVFGLRGDSEIKVYLESPGVIEQLEDKVTEKGENDTESPLVAQAHAFALRIDPPPPPMPVKSDPPPSPQDRTRNKPKPVRPQPDRSFGTKFDLLATVLCQADSTRSMVLLKQGTGKEEWFRQGETVGRLKIDEVRDGSAVFLQDGGDPQELFVPVKPQVQSLLKADANISTRPEGPSGINIPSDASDAVLTTPQTTAAEGGTAARPNLSRAATSAKTASDRIQRLRTVPKRPTAAQQKASIEVNIESIQEIMNRQDASISEKQRKEENEAWTGLLKALQSEKEKLEPAVKPEENQNRTSASDDEKKSESGVEETDPNQK